jgi:hypothetical protein
VDAMGIVPDAQRDELSSEDAILHCIRELTPLDARLRELMQTPLDAQHSRVVADGIMYTKGWVEVLDDNQLWTNILKTRHDSKMAGHPGRAKTLSLVRRCYTWPSQKRFLNRYVDGCESCQRTKPTTQKPYGALEPLPIPAGPGWTSATTSSRTYRLQTGQTQYSRLLIA